ncbi:MAG: SCO family protein [Pusillimonas sp.]
MISFLPSRRAGLKLACALATSLLLAACGPEPKQAFLGSDITGTGLGKDLAMVDHTGQPRTLANYKGKALVVFFGFTHCPDVCPTALAQLAQTTQLLGDRASEVQILMVSVDPERDTPDIMGRYVKAFDDTFIGLTGTPQQLQQTAKSFKAYYAKVPDKINNTYSMDHSASFYLFDKTGQARVLASGTSSAQDLASDIKSILD